MEFLRCRQEGDKTRAAIEAKTPSAMNGFWSSTMGQAVDASLAGGRKLDGGKIVVGAPVQINDLLERELGAAAGPYKVKLIG